ncbi:hypothetical protein AMATHDRAFT_136270 [Amanita thiersii Skay4041]|uniref:Endonuclease/exonuclease/phosphatase domain-containing protein n=1 Tax=Amanita thiersii Skay4041 TaxID=703135 RepID=A0A2A9NSJ6_9AGAR|nr:hypothetical protein AMATHDRAFT_136270 [Amanita thiersii Skay4041]
MLFILPIVLLASILRLVLSTTITDIQGEAWLSPLVGQTVTNITGLVTAKTSNGFFLRGEDVVDIRISIGLFVFTTSTSILGMVNVGDQVSLGGRVSEFRSSSAPNDLSLTELTSPTNIITLSSGNTVTPIVLGKDRSPPTQQLSALDVGGDGFLSVPNNNSRIEVTNAPLLPDAYGLDFWESLEGQLVTIPSPTVMNFQNSFKEFWVYGAWTVTGRNGRGGLTITFGPDGVPDANPEAIIIGRPLDGTKNPSVSVGMRLADITGTVYYQFGFYYVLPLTAPTIISSASDQAVPSDLVSTESCELLLGDYNVANLAPTSSHLPRIATHISQFLQSPDIVFLQEVQDGSGPKDDGVVSANLTLTTLVNAIANISGVQYSFIDIPPVNNQDGGEPGGNIRVAYLYRPDKVSLVTGPPIGGTLDAVKFQHRKLNFNPGRIDPTNPVWADSRKPLVAAWKTSHGRELITINVHLVSKGGSSSTQGNARPPINSPVDIRAGQVNAVAQFVQSVLSHDAKANIVAAGDYNEYVETRSVFKPLKDLLFDVDEVAGIPPAERYTYIFDQNTEQLDHIFVSEAIKNRLVDFRHVHVNTWAPSVSAQASDHDPSVVKIRVC